MKRACSGDWRSCAYSFQGGQTYIGCRYSGYCDFQLPNDGRYWRLPTPNEPNEPPKYPKGGDQ